MPWGLFMQTCHANKRSVLALLWLHIQCRPHSQLPEHVFNPVHIRCCFYITSQDNWSCVSGCKSHVERSSSTWSPLLCCNWSFISTGTHIHPSIHHLIPDWNWGGKGVENFRWMQTREGKYSFLRMLHWSCKHANVVWPNVKIPIMKLNHSDYLSDRGLIIIRY